MGRGWPVTVGALGAGELRELDQAVGDAAGQDVRGRAVARNPEGHLVVVAEDRTPRRTWSSKSRTWKQVARWFTTTLST